MQKANPNLEIITQTVGSSYKGQIIGNNIYVTLEGNNKEAGVFVIGAHTDTLKGSSGIIDNWSSCVALSEIYRRVSLKDFEHTFIFVGFTGEERGQLGSKTFVHRLRPGTRKRIKAFINLECLGVGNPQVWTNKSSDDLENIFCRSCKFTGQNFSKQTLFGFKSDATSFTNASIPAITIHSLESYNLFLINSYRDSKEAINFQRYCKTIDTLFEFIKTLDSHKEKIKLANAGENLSPACSSVITEITENNKIRIKEINTESAEYKSGLRKGDIISAVNGIELKSSSQLSTMFMTLHQGSEVSYYLQKNPARKDDENSASKINSFKKFEREIIVRY
jgi:hypothetical protein